MKLFPGEPAAGPWRVEPIATVLGRRPVVAARPAHGSGRPDPADTGPAGTGGGTVIVAVDGRSAGGKTTTAGRIAATVPGATVVHTDDVAWYESFFGWAHLLRDGVLDPARRGLERDGDDEAGVAFREEWDAQEIPFLAADRPWERAAGGAALPYDPAAELVVADRMMSR